MSQVQKPRGSSQPGNLEDFGEDGNYEMHIFDIQFYLKDGVVQYADLV